MRDQAEAFLADARAREGAARAQGQSYSVALQRTRAAHALIALGRPEEALTDLDAALDYTAMLRSDGDMARARSRSQVRRMLAGRPGLGLSHDIRLFMFPPRPPCGRSVDNSCDPVGSLSPWSSRTSRP